MLPGKKRAKMEMRQLQTGKEVKQELNVQDQVECLSQEPTATEKGSFSSDGSPSQRSLLDTCPHVAPFFLSQVELELESVKKQHAANADSSSLATTEEVSVLR